MAVSIKHLPESERPRERLLQAGREALSDVELVALVIGGDLGCAATVVRGLGGARGIHRAVLGELLLLPGVGVARACQLLAALELGRRAQGASEDLGAPLRTPADGVARFRDMTLLEQEELHVIGLDSRHRQITRFVAARGSLNAVHVSTRDVFRRLLREGAAAAIVAHNHPSGDPAPSPADLDLTHRLRAAGELVGVPLLDHLVIGCQGFHSFADQLRFPTAG